MQMPIRDYHCHGRSSKKQDVLVLMGNGVFIQNITALAHKRHLTHPKLKTL